MEAEMNATGWLGLEDWYATRQTRAGKSKSWVKNEDG
jgi:hypothetical protein